MKTVLSWIGIFFLCFLLQTTLIPSIRIMNIGPDLLMVALFFLARKTGPFGGLWAGFFLGLAQDLFSPSIMGQNAVSRTVAGFFAGLFNERVMRIDVVFQFILLLITFFIHDALYYAVQAATGASEGSVFRSLVAVTLPRALFSLLFAVIPFVKTLFFPTDPRR